MAIHSTHLETLEAVIATALNVVKNRTLADLYVRRNYTGEFRVRVQLESGQRYVITSKKNDSCILGWLHAVVGKPRCEHRIALRYLRLDRRRNNRLKNPPSYT